MNCDFIYDSTGTIAANLHCVSTSGFDFATPSSIAINNSLNLFWIGIGIVVFFQAVGIGLWFFRGGSK